MTKVVAAVTTATAVVATVYCAPAVIAAVSSGGAAVIGATVTTITSAAQLLQGTPAYV